MDKPERSYDRFILMIATFVEQQHMFRGFSDESIEFVIQQPENAIPMMIEKIENRFIGRKPWLGHTEADRRNKFKIKKFKSVDAFMSAIKKNGWTITSEARYMMKHPSFILSDREDMVSLAKPSGNALGFDVGGVKFPLLYPRANQFGLAVCPADVGAQLCLHMKIEKHGSDLFIAMDPIPGPDGKPMIFWLYHNGAERYLGAREATKDSRWKGGDWRYVFLEELPAQ